MMMLHLFRFTGKIILMHLNGTLSYKECLVILQIKPKVSGIVEELYVEEGSMIKKGDLIAKVRIIPNMVSKASV